MSETGEHGHADQPNASPQRKAALTRRKAPRLSKPKPRETELIGLTDDGRLVLWSVEQVAPINAFETTHDGRYIVEGHYVVQWKNHAITVHCGNFANGDIALIFMCSRSGFVRMRRDEIEPLLLGRIMPDPAVDASIRRSLKKLGDSIARLNDTQDRQRGRIA